MPQELFDLGDETAVNCNPGGKFHGWLFRRHPDGQYVSVRKLEAITPADALFDALDIWKPPPGATDPGMEK